MKTSRIIFISYFSIIGLFLLGIMVTAYSYRFEENIKKINPEKIEITPLDLEPFSHLNIEKNCYVAVFENTNNKLAYNSINEAEDIKPDYEVRNDTLFIKSSTTSKHNNWVTVNAKDIKTISGANCSVTIKKLNQESLAIDLFKSKLRLQDKVNLGLLDLNLRGKSSFDGYNFKVKGVNMKIKSSTARFNSKIKIDTLQGTVSDKSDIRLPKAKHLQLDVDESSKMKMY